MRFLVLPLIVLSVVTVLWCVWIWAIGGVAVYDANFIAFQQLTPDDLIRMSNTSGDIFQRLFIPTMVLNIVWLVAGIAESCILVRRKHMADTNGVDRREEDRCDREHDGITTLARQIKSTLQRDVKDLFLEFLGKRTTSRITRGFLLLMIVLTIVVVAWCAVVYRSSGITFYGTNALAFKKLTAYNVAGICDAFDGILLMLAIPSMLLNVLWGVAAVPMYRALRERTAVESRGGAVG
jgi:hypothetical protein